MRRLVGGCVIALVAAVLPACGGKSGNPAGPSTNPGAAPVVITIVGDKGNTSFLPNPAVAGGQMVVFRNMDTITHRIQLNDASLDFGTVAPGATTQAILMPSAGANYHCTIHLTMVGAVSPNATDPPPPCRDIYC